MRKSKAQRLHDYYIGWYLKEKTFDLLAPNIVDHDQFLRLDHRVAGVYKIDVIQYSETKEVIRRLTALYGESEDIGLRWCQYTKIWFGAIADRRGDYYEYYTGLDRSDESWKIEFSVVSEVDDPIERIALERSLIRTSSHRPYLQDTCSGKYPLYRSDGPEDCCIAPYTHQCQARKLALRDAIKKYDEIQNRNKIR